MNLQKLLKYTAYFLASLLLIGALLDTIANTISLITPKVTYWGTGLLLAIWCGLVIYIRKKGVEWSFPGGKKAKVTKVNSRIHLFFAGAIFSLWLPIIFSTSDNNQIIAKLNEINIGVSRSFAESMLGSPKYMANFDSVNISDEYYIIDQVVVRLLYQDDIIQAFFVTICDEKYKGLIPVSIYEHVVNGKKLGEFSFYDIEYVPLKIRGFLQNGTGYGCYIEAYYFASSGNYRTFFFANLPYGLLEAEFDFGSQTLDDELEGEMADIDIDTHLDCDRKKSFPSTFGVIGRDLDDDFIFDILTDWSKIDYSSLLIDLK